MPTKAGHMTTARRERIPEERRRRIAQRIRDLRTTRTKFAQGELAKRAGIDPATMNQIEQAKRLPDLATVLSLAEQLGVQPSAILDDGAEATARDATTPGVQPVSVSALQAATTASLASLVATLVAALGDWHAANISREDGSALPRTAGVSRTDRG